MLLKLIAVFFFLLGILVGGLWLLIELAGAVADGGDSVWYVALVLTLIPAVLLAVVAYKSRTGAFIGLAAAAVALTVGVLVTHPGSSSSACPSGSNASGEVTVPSDDLGGALVDDVSDAAPTPEGC